MAVLDEFVKFVSDNTSNGSWQKPNLMQRSAEFLATHDMGGGLPEVTDADNGDVLTVVEGQWAKSAPSGGVMFVQVSEVPNPEEGHEGAKQLNKTFNEIKEAIANGVLPVSIAQSEDEVGITTAEVMTLAHIEESDDPLYTPLYTVVFATYAINDVYSTTDPDDYPQTVGGAPK